MSENPPLNICNFGENFKLFAAYCDTCARENGLPAWQNFNAAEIFPCLGHVNAITVLDGGEDFLFRVYGTGLAEFFRTELTGKKVTEALSARRTAISLKFYRRVVETRHAQCIVYDLDNLEPLPINFLDDKHFMLRYVVPFSKDGNAVERLLGYGERVNEQTVDQVLNGATRIDTGIYPVSIKQ